jgi:hypothetical protein
MHTVGVADLAAPPGTALTGTGNGEDLPVTPMSDVRPRPFRKPIV